MSPDAQSALRGLLYFGKKREQGGDRKSEESKCQNDTLISTAETVAKETGVSPATVNRDAKLIKALDRIGIPVADFMAGSKDRVDRPILDRHHDVSPSDHPLKSDWDNSPSPTGPNP